MRKLWRWLDKPLFPGDDPNRGGLAPRWWLLLVVVVVAAIELFNVAGY